MVKECVTIPIRQSKVFDPFDKKIRMATLLFNPTTKYTQKKTNATVQKNGN